MSQTFNLNQFDNQVAFICDHCGRETNFRLASKGCSLCGGSIMKISYRGTLTPTIDDPDSPNRTDPYKEKNLHRVRPGDEGGMGESAFGPKDRDDSVVGGDFYGTETDLDNRKEQQKNKREIFREYEGDQNVSEEGIDSNWLADANDQNPQRDLDRGVSPRGDLSEQSAASRVHRRNRGKSVDIFGRVQSQL